VKVDQTPYESCTINVEVLTCCPYLQVPAMSVDKVFTSGRPRKVINYCAITLYMQP